jgi:hypothetical protein
MYIEEHPRARHAVLLMKFTSHRFPDDFCFRPIACTIQAQPGERLPPFILSTITTPGVLTKLKNSASDDRRKKTPISFDDDDI